LLIHADDEVVQDDLKTLKRLQPTIFQTEDDRGNDLRDSAESTETITTSDELLVTDNTPKKSTAPSKKSASKLQKTTVSGKSKPPKLRSLKRTPSSKNGASSASDSSTTKTKVKPTNVKPTKVLTMITHRYYSFLLIFI
jgi:hypothetical protein